MSFLDLTSPPPPLYVDLDHSFLKVDVLQECVVWLFFHDFWFLIRSFLSLTWCPIKAALSKRYPLDPTLFPKNLEVLELMHAHKKQGGHVVLATAAHEKLANFFSKDFDDVLASSDIFNLKGVKKREAIQTHAQGQRFWYVGDSQADIPIFEKAEKAFVVGNLPCSIRGITRIASDQLPVVFVVRGWWRHAFFLLYPFIDPSSLRVSLPLSLGAFVLFGILRASLDTLSLLRKSPIGCLRSLPVFLGSLGCLLLSLTLVPFLGFIFVIPGAVSLLDVLYDLKRPTVKVQKDATSAYTLPVSSSS